MDDRSADESPYLHRGERDVIRLRNPTEDKRALRRMLTSADPWELAETKWRTNTEDLGLQQAFRSFDQDSGVVHNQDEG